jgi:hypothetical protein
MAARVAAAMAEHVGITVFAKTVARQGLPVSALGTSERPNPFHVDTSAWSHSGDFQNPTPSDVLPFLTRI